MLTSRRIFRIAPLSGTNNRSIAGPLLMLAAALIFAVLDGLIKLMGPAFRVWDIDKWVFLGWRSFDTRQCYSTSTYNCPAGVEELK